MVHQGVSKTVQGSNITWLWHIWKYPALETIERMPEQILSSKQGSTRSPTDWKRNDWKLCERSKTKYKLHVRIRDCILVDGLWCIAEELKRYWKVKCASCWSRLKVTLSSIHTRPVRYYSFYQKHTQHIAAALVFANRWTATNKTSCICM